MKEPSISLFISSYSCKPSEALSCFNKCRRDKQYGRQAVYAMVKIVLNPDNEVIASEEDWKRRLHGYVQLTTIDFEDLDCTLIV